MDDVHTVPHDDGWAIETDGALRSSSSHMTKAGVAKAGHEAAKIDKSELRIHGRDGEIRDSDNFGNNPHPLKDRRQ